MLYMLALSTGFRAGELASLTWGSLNLSESEASVTVSAAYSKNRKDATLPLRKDIAQQLGKWRAEYRFDSK